jgi:hypothetical protein
LDSNQQNPCSFCFLGGDCFHKNSIPNTSCIRNYRLLGYD